MRSAALAISIALLLGGCAAGAPATQESQKSGYNRRELRPDTPGVLTGPDGVWTIYSSSHPAKSATDARPTQCAPVANQLPPATPDGACPAPAKPRTVLLPKP